MMSVFNQSVNVFRRLFTYKVGCHQKILWKKKNCCFLSTTSTEKEITMQDVKENLMKIMGITPGYKLTVESRSHLLKYLPASQAEMEPRSMQDSFASAILPLSTNIRLQDKYVTVMGNVRLGRLLEDMDMFAVWVVTKHIKNNKQEPGQPSPYTIVTLLVDKIDFTDYKPVHDQDIRLSGHVSWVGSSSVEVVVWLEQRWQGRWQRLTRALFLMAARDSTNGAAASVNPIEPASAHESSILEGGQARRDRRRRLQQSSLLRAAPGADEQAIVHALYLDSAPAHEVSLVRRELPPGCGWMEDAAMSSVVFSHPENRNLHAKVFGGFVMRMATELGWSLARVFAGRRPQLRHLSDIRFHRPIDVSALIRMHASVVYTCRHALQLTVYVESFDMETRARTTTNAFHLTYEVDEADELPARVVPRTYHEAMMYLDGRRHFLDAVGESNAVADTGITAAPASPASPASPA